VIQLGKIRPTELARVGIGNAAMLWRMILGASSAGVLQHHPQPGVKRGSVLEATGVGRELHQWLRSERARRPASALDLPSVRESAAIVASWPGLKALVEMLARILLAIDAGGA